MNTSNSSDPHFIVEPVSSKKVSDQYVFVLETVTYPLTCIKYNVLMSSPLNVYEINDNKYLVPKHALFNWPQFLYINHGESTKKSQFL